MLLIFLSEKYNVIFGVFPPTEERVCIVKKFFFLIGYGIHKFAIQNQKSN